MKKITVETHLDVYDSLEELPVSIQKLFNKAQQARDTAYAPYSHFTVGVAITLDNGKIIQGSNQENAAYPSGLCAERVAVFYAGATFPNAVITALAITVKSSDKIVTTPVAPCGACRQSLAEYEIKQKSPMAVYFMGETGKIIKAPSIKALLPLGFDSSFLGRN